MVILNGLIEFVLWSCLGHHPHTPGDLGRFQLRGDGRAVAGHAAPFAFGWTVR